VKGEATSFGGSWTEDKLDRVRQYLVQYARIMRKKRYRFAYIDAFAGTGYRVSEEPDEEAVSLFPELFESETREFLDGSARIALQSEPRFNEYIFIESRKGRCEELASLRKDFADKAEDIIVVPNEANTYLRKLCAERDWSNNRALLFLDPYGMQVEWETLVAVAATQAIDLWLLFPLGVAVSRLLVRDGDIPDSWAARLDKIFGTHDWFEAFYVTETQPGLFREEPHTRRVADVERIGEYFVGRLGEIFAGVARNPLALRNSKKSPLFLLCFATANPYAVEPALRIAEHILGKAG
jgi:three-Cys-motif partner protein